MSGVKLKLKKDDIVEVIAGREKGKKGKILTLHPEDGKLTVEKLNMVKRHTKPSAQNKQGGIVEKEGQLAIFQCSFGMRQVRQGCSGQAQKTGRRQTGARLYEMR